MSIDDFFISALTITFIILKLTGYIEWAWVWVLSPMWIPLALLAVLMVFVGILKLIYTVIGEP
jgi:hypothetical protein